MTYPEAIQFLYGLRWFGAKFGLENTLKLAALAGVISRADAAPTDQSYVVYDDLVSQIDVQLQRLAQVMKTDVPAFNQLVKEQNVPAVVVRPPAGDSQRQQ